jgi:hypothetical protein
MAVIAALCLGLFCNYQYSGSQAKGKAAAAVPKITLFNPLGAPPATALKKAKTRPELQMGVVDSKRSISVISGLTPDRATTFYRRRIRRRLPS